MMCMVVDAFVCSLVVPPFLGNLVSRQCGCLTCIHVYNLVAALFSKWVLVFVVQVV